MFGLHVLSVLRTIACLSWSGAEGQTCDVDCEDVSKLVPVFFEERMSISAELQSLPDEGDPTFDERRLVFSSGEKVC